MPPIAGSPALSPFGLVHPELRAALDPLVARDPAFLAATTADISPQVLAQHLSLLRRAWAGDASHVPDCARIPVVTRHMIAGSAGAPDVGVFIINAIADASRPAILHMHGGGFIVGSAEEYVPVLQAQAMALDCVIVTVDYRLAPEVPFPGALEDNYAALVWLHGHGDYLGVDTSRIAIQGESAGGGHAAMLAIAARDRGEVPILFLCLTYPMLDDRTGSSRSVPEHIGTYCWTPKYNRMGWSALLGVTAGGADVPVGAVPARAEDLSDLPATFLCVGSTDLFLQENLEFAGRLALAGVPLELHVIPGAYHGFDGAAPGSSVTINYKLALLRALAAALGTRLHPDTISFITPRSGQHAGPV